jgi:hypothetical protein
VLRCSANATKATRHALCMPFLQNTFNDYLNAIAQ